MLSLALHPQIINIVNNSETVGRRKNLWKQKLLISTFYVYLSQFLLATINGFWVMKDHDDMRMYCILRSSRSLITQKRLVGEKTYKNKSCLSRRFTSNKVNFFWLWSMVSELSSILMILGCTSLLLEAHHRTTGRRGRRNLKFFS